MAVVNDVKLESARDPAMPQGFLLSDRPMWDLSIHKTDAERARHDVEALWKAYGPPLVYDIQRADDQRASVYRQEQQLSTMLAAVALLAVVVAMLGAYALVADTVRRRRTELTLHRLHGASDIAITRQVFTEFAVPLAISMAAGLPSSTADWELIVVHLGMDYRRIGIGDRVSVRSFGSDMRKSLLMRRQPQLHGRLPTATILVERIPGNCVS